MQPSDISYSKIFSADYIIILVIGNVINYQLPITNMTKPDYRGAVQYALSRLEAELPQTAVYHNLWHTQAEVLPTAIALGQAAGLTKAELRLLEVAAAFHDLGITVQLLGHEAIGATMAQTQLPRFGFKTADISTIAGIIRATHLPQNPNNLLEAIMADADVDVLGRESDFWQRNALLRQELQFNGHIVSDKEWYQQQFAFISNHRYFTVAAKQQRGPGKQQIIAQLAKRISG